MSFDLLNTKKARITFIRNMLSTNTKWAIRAVVRIYENQTEDEQSIGNTVEDNGIGFSGCDAVILSSFAQQIKAGRTMSQKQMAIIFRKIPKYAKQIEGVSQ